MTDLNSVTILGRITRDLDDKSYAVSANGTARAKISIAVNRSVKKDNQWTDEVSFFDVTIWGKTAENLKSYLRKGTQVAVQGYLKQDRWQDKQSGQARSTVGIVADNIQLVSGKKDSGRQGGAPSFAPQGNGGFNPAEGFPEDFPF